MKILDIIYVLIMSVIEGITEWLPISSTAHLILASKFLEFMRNNTLFTIDFLEVFDVVIQFGAVLSVLVIFGKDFMSFKSGKKEKFSLLGKVVIATIPAIIFGLFLDDNINKLFFNLKTISITLIFYGVVFLLIEKYFKNKNAINDVCQITYLKALYIGLIQVLAIIPGTSRSGITIIAGLLFSLDRKTAATFSFYLSMPIILGASSLKIFKYVIYNSFTINQIVILLIGVLGSFLVSLFVIKLLISFTSKHTFKGFAYYRIVLGITIIICLLLNLI